MKKPLLSILILSFSIPLFAQHKSETDIVNDFWRNEPIQLVKGNVTSAASFNADGENTNVGTGLEDINNSNASLNWILGPHRVKVNSTSSSDGTAANGIRTVTVTGLDENWVPISATLTLAANGTDSVTSASTIKFIRVFKLEAATVGTGGVAAGTVKVVTKESDTLLAQIDVGYNQSFQARYSIPASSYGYIKSIYAMSNVAAKANNVYLYAREFGEPWKRVFPIEVNASSFNYEFAMPYEFGAKADIEIRALSAGGSGSIAAGFSGWYEP